MASMPVLQNSFIAKEHHTSDLVSLCRNPKVDKGILYDAMVEARVPDFVCEMVKLWLLTLGMLTNQRQLDFALFSDSTRLIVSPHQETIPEKERLSVKETDYKRYVAIGMRMEIGQRLLSLYCMQAYYVSHIANDTVYAIRVPSVLIEKQVLALHSLIRKLGHFRGDPSIIETLRNTVLYTASAMSRNIVSYSDEYGYHYNSTPDYSKEPDITLSATCEAMLSDLLNDYIREEMVKIEQMS